MRTSFPGTEPTTRVLQHVDDETKLATLGPKQIAKEAIIVLTNSPNALYIFREGSVAAAKAGSVVVPSYISSSTAYVADPTTAPGRFENILATATASGLLEADLVATANLVGTRSGNVITATSNGALGAIDGVTVTVGMLVLLTAQTAGADNGLYLVTSVGGASAKWKMVRAPNADNAAEFAAGQPIYVAQGMAFAGQYFNLTTTGAITLNTTALTYVPRQTSDFHVVRGVVTSNTSLTAFAGVTGGTPVDGVTYVQGDRVLLVGQSTAAQNGIYVVGVVAAGTAALYRAADWALSTVQAGGSLIRASEGTAWANIEWFASAGAITVGTTTPAFYPKRYGAVSGALSGTPGTLAISSQWILAATSRVNLTAKTPGGTMGSLSYGTLTPGAGSGSFTITSSANESSTVAYEIING